MSQLKLDLNSLKSSRHFILRREQFSREIIVQIGCDSYKMDSEELKELLEHRLQYNEEISNRIFSYLFSFNKVIIDTSTGRMSKVL